MLKETLDCLEAENDKRHTVYTEVVGTTEMEFNEDYSEAGLMPCLCVDEL